ncbi:MAG: ABC transporter substrate-binding protein [Hyphomicrobiales bacterium]
MARPIKPGLTRRALGRGLLATGAAGFAYGSGRAPAIGQGAKNTLRVGIFGGDFGNLSPVLRYYAQTGIVMCNMMDGLVTIDYADNRVVPALAEAWSNPDPLTWRIKMREGVRWHKGYGEVTAEDLAYTWNFHLSSKSFQVGTALFPIDTIKQDGKYVVEVKTKRPFAGFPGITMGYGGQLVSAKAHKEMGNEAYSATPIGNGAFILESKRGTEIVLTKNPEYWRQGSPKLDRIVYRAVPDANTRLQALVNGEFDFITHPEPKQVGDISKNTNFTVSSTPGWEWDFQEFNLTVRPDLPIHNKLVRQAISYAIDREAIVSEIYYGQGVATDNQVPPGFLGHRGHLQRYPKNGDLNKAKELMAQAGVRGFDVEVITGDYDWIRKELELVAAMVSQIGVNYKIRNLDMGGYNNLWLNRRYEAVLQDVTIVAPDTDATSWWFLNSKGIAAASNDPEMDRLTDTAREELDLAKRTSLYHQIVDRTLEECPFIYFANANYIHVYNKNVRGFKPSPQEYIEKLDTVYWT